VEGFKSIVEVVICQNSGGMGMIVMTIKSCDDMKI
jgi:hypothetical protein